MKKLKAGCLAAVCVLALLVAVVLSVGTMRKEKLRDRPPLTLEELNRIAASESEPTDNQTTASDKPRQLTAGDSSVLGEEAAAPPENGEPRDELPRCLNNTATEQDRRDIFCDKPAAARVIAILGTSPLGNFVDAMGVAAGVPEGASANLGEVHAIRGNWAEARSCYSEYVRKADDSLMRRVAFARLAWLEDDPELAARYMELASRDRDIYPLHLCVGLAYRTGSRELFEHYQGLLEQAKAEKGSP